MAVDEMDLSDIPMIIMKRVYEHFLSVNIDILSSESYHIGFEECDFSKVAELERAIIYSFGRDATIKTFAFINCNLPDYFLAQIEGIFDKNRLFNIIVINFEYEIILDAGTLHKSPLYRAHSHLLKTACHEIERAREKGNEFLVASAIEQSVSVSQKSEDRTRNKGKCVIS